MKNVSLKPTSLHDSYVRLNERYLDMVNTNLELIREIARLKDRLSWHDSVRASYNTAVRSGSKLIPLYPEKGGEQ